MANDLPERSWGDTEQLRSIMDQVAEKAANRVLDGSDVATKTFVREEDERMMEKVKGYFTKLALGWLVTAVPVIFFLGGIWSDGKAVLADRAADRIVLEQRGIWMQERERWEIGIESCLRNGRIEDCEPVRYRSPKQ